MCSWSYYFTAPSTCSVENECEIARPLVSSSRAQLRDLSCRRENSTYEEVRHSKSYGVRCLPLPSHLLSDRCARKISRFARNDNTGKAILSFSACSRRIFPLSFIPRVPYPPLQGTFPSRGRLWVHGGGILVSPPSPWEKDFGLLPPSFGRRCPEGAEVSSRSGMKGNVR